MNSRRADREIAHGKKLARGDPELSWGWKTPAGRVRAEKRAERIAAAARLGPEALALEIGCGTGLFTEMFAKTGARIVAVDISSELLEQAAARNLPPDRVRFERKRFEECDLDGPFDAVIGSSVMHHLELDEALPRIFELLKPGGIMSFAEPNLLNPQIFLERKFTFLRKRLPQVSPDETAFLRGRLRDCLGKAGFVDIEIVPLDWLHPGVPERWIPLANRIGRLLEKIPLIREFAGSVYIRCRRPG